jgi:hypothetical protein
VGTGEGGRMGALGRAGECEEARCEAGVDDSAKGCWFMAAREESWGMLVLAAGTLLVWGGGSRSEGAWELETQQPWVWS